MGEEGLWKDNVMRNQLLPEDVVITAEMPEQDWHLLLPILPALMYPRGTFSLFWA